MKIDKTYNFKGAEKTNAHYNIQCYILETFLAEV